MWWFGKESMLRFGGKGNDASEQGKDVLLTSGSLL